jgi:molybdenum cofactor guanylyltransferase
VAVGTVANKVTGVILAGGRSRRMGTDKALLRLGSDTMLEHGVHTLESTVRHVVIAGGEAGRYVLPGIACLGDAIADGGPLGGILAALEFSNAPTVLVLACDLPFIAPPLMRLLLTADPTVPILIPRSGNVVQPLCGRYATSLGPDLRSFMLRGRRKVMEFVSTCQHAYLDIEPGHPLYHPSLFSNINFRGDLEQAASIMQKRGTPTE